MSDPSYTGRRVTRLKALVLGEYGGTCHLCGQAGADTVDHLIPRSLGGLDSLDNCRPAHRECNSKRGTMSLKAWFETNATANRVEPSRKW